MQKSAHEIENKGDREHGIGIREDRCREGSATGGMHESVWQPTFLRGFGLKPGPKYNEINAASIAEGRTKRLPHRLMHPRRDKKSAQRIDCKGVQERPLRGVVRKWLERQRLDGSVGELNTETRSVQR